MECPVCKCVFPKYKEILILINRSFYCHHCWSRLISYPDPESGCRVETDPLGDKWEKLAGTAPAAR
jgi:hypothetical protein